MCAKCLSENFKERERERDRPRGELEGLDFKPRLYSQLSQDGVQWWTFEKKR
jgi:hypothetical protein